MFSCRIFDLAGDIILDMTTNDLELLEQYATHGSEDAFAELAHRHLDLIWGEAPLGHEVLTREHTQEASEGDIATAHARASAEHGVEGRGIARIMDVDRHHRRRPGRAGVRRRGEHPDRDGEWEQVSHSKSASPEHVDTPFSQARGSRPPRL